MLVNQVCVVPFLYFPLFFAWRGFCRSESVAHTLALARKEWWPTLKLIWTFWVPAQSLLFSTVPVETLNTEPRGPNPSPLFPNT